MSSIRSWPRLLLECILSGAAVAAAVAAEHSVPLLPAVSATGPQGFVRVINHSDIPGEVIIDAFDETGRWYGPLVLSVRAGGTTHFNSHDLENGNASKGLLGRTGSGDGDWRLTLASRLDIEVLSYVRTPDGFLTAMNGVAPSADKRYRVPIFNPGSNVSQRSVLRLLNPGGVTAEVVIEGVDDAGASPGAPVRLSMPARSARMIPSDVLEVGGSGLDGKLGDGSGKWRLDVEADQPVVVMSLLTSPTGHITNLSAAPHRGATIASFESGFRDPLAAGGEGPPMVVVPAGQFRMGCLADEQDPFAEDAPVYECSSDELPVRDVTIGRPFALSAHEITFADWEACVEDGGCNGYRPEDEGWGRGSRPVIHVSWNDAQRYVAWLSRSTGATYRLPSEAEWDYAARAGSTTAFPWGNAIRAGRANCNDDHCEDGHPNTAPVGRFPANAGACTTCRATFTSGCRTAGTAARTSAVRRTVAPGRTVAATVAVTAADPGGAPPPVCAWRDGVSPGPPCGKTGSGSAWCARCHTLDLASCPCSRRRPTAAPRDSSV